MEKGTNTKEQKHDQNIVSQICVKCSAMIWTYKELIY